MRVSNCPLVVLSMSGLSHSAPKSGMDQGKCIYNGGEVLLDAGGTSCLRRGSEAVEKLHETRNFCHHHFSLDNFLSIIKL